MKYISFLFLVLLQSCSVGTNHPETGFSKTVEYDEDDPRVLKARKSVRDSLGFYLGYFKKYYGQQDHKFYLKGTFQQGDNFERMWCRPFGISGNSFNCTLDKNPLGLTNYKSGDTLRIDFLKIEDFIIVMPGSVAGNYLNEDNENDYD